MISDQLINTIITSSIAGAGLIFASYSIIISFSDRIKQFKEGRIKEARNKIKGNKGTDELRELVDEIEKREATPFYLSQFVYVIFLLYILSAIFGLIYLNANNPSSSLGQTSIWCFGISTGLFGIMGLSLLQDFLEFIRDILKVRKGK